MKIKCFIVHVYSIFFILVIFLDINLLESSGSDLYF